MDEAAGPGLGRLEPTGGMFMLMAISSILTCTPRDPGRDGPRARTPWNQTLSPPLQRAQPIQAEGLCTGPASAP